MRHDDPRQACPRGYRVTSRGPSLPFHAGGTCPQWTGPGPSPMPYALMLCAAHSLRVLCPLSLLSTRRKNLWSVHRIKHAPPMAIFVVPLFHHLPTTSCQGVIALYCCFHRLACIFLCFRWIVHTGSPSSCPSSVQIKLSPSTFRSAFLHLTIFIWSTF